MPVPKHIFEPPFNTVRSHIALGVADLGRSRAFYAEALGLIVEDADREILHLGGIEERQHHSLVLRDGEVPTAHYLGFKVGCEEESRQGCALLQGAGDRARARRATLSRPYADGRRPLRHAGRTSLCHGKRERLLQRSGARKGVQPQRLDHFNVLAPNVQGSVEFHAALGFRLTEYAEEDRPSGYIAAAWMHRKGNVHDLAFTQWQGAAPAPSGLLGANAAADHSFVRSVATTGDLANLERGPGRHGISNAFFLYVRCPDGHRLEVYSCDYQTIGPDHEPIRWNLRDLAGRRCGVSRRRAPGLRKAPSLPASSRARRCSRPTWSLPI